MVKNDSYARKRKEILTPLGLPVSILVRWDPSADELDAIVWEINAGRIVSVTFHQNVLTKIHNFDDLGHNLNLFRFPNVDQDDSVCHRGSDGRE
jgi:hypothetical protein